MKPFAQPVRPEDVAALVDLTVAGHADTQSMADLQLEGIAAIYNILCERSLAYLADEVGMGKTYQALGLVALIWNEKPDARVLFICPRQNLQVKWRDDYVRFYASNYRRKQGLGDDRAASILFGEPVHRPVLFHNLRSWTPTIGMRERIAPILRHTSFTRPVYVTSNDLGAMNELWDRTSQKLRSWGLFDARRPQRLSQGNASEQLSLAFADALNAKLTEEVSGRPYFDLVIVDEAQCLRNPDNQTNRVLFAALKDHVNKWLFMSATPAHSGPEDIPKVVNHYPDKGKILDPNLVKDLSSMQEALQAFLVRRSRQYSTRPANTTVGKVEYRKHESQGWGVPDDEMRSLDTLAMGLVQKGLVNVLGGRSNRYRIGFLSSFESLQSSVERTLPVHSSDSDAQDEQADGDWHRDRIDSLRETEAPDSRFIHRLATSFEERFGKPLPHPKLDSVVNRVSPLAFGTDTEQGGHKFLVFTRRVSTVSALCERLILRHQKSIEDRVRRCWGKRIDWGGSSARVEESDDAEDPEGFDTDPGTSPFRAAMSRKGWLFRYRQTFRASGRNALFFEDGWLRRLCRAGGVEPSTAAANLPQALWAESWTHASRSAGMRRQQYRAERVRYLAVQAIRRFPGVFGLDDQSATPWRTAYEAVLHDHLPQADPAEKPHDAPELFTQPTLWTEWDERFPDGPLSLPGCAPQRVQKAADPCDDLYRRQIARTLLGQTFRLTDTLLDLYFADTKSEQDSDGFPKRFLDWLDSNDPSSRQVRRECAQWIEHLRLILDSCLEGAGKSWRELASRESWSQLYNPLPVIGVVGGSSAHSIATKQFRTPSNPRVIVCTDTLKEGVDLHLFCDRVLHYGVAWTSGDLEQRVGRVDRFFSQIERRLQQEGAPPDVNLHIGYPHVVASLEREQIQRVIERQERAEQLMDSALASMRGESNELVAGASSPREDNFERVPYAGRRNRYPRNGRQIVAVSKREARESARHYGVWWEHFVEAARACGWEVSPEHGMPVREATLFGKNAGAEDHKLEWRFDASLGRYIITLSNFQWANCAAVDMGRRRRLIGRNYRDESFLGLLVPTPEEGLDLSSICRLTSVLKGELPRPDRRAAANWDQPLSLAANGDVKWVSDHAASAVIPRRDRNREQRITLIAQEGSVQLSSIVAPRDELEHRSEWGGAPTAENIRSWALKETNRLTLGHLAVHDRESLIFGVHVLHGDAPEGLRRQLIDEVAWRADAWEAALTGTDRR